VSSRFLISLFPIRFSFWGAVLYTLPNFPVRFLFFSSLADWLAD
jgi:hypothetical protein